MPKKFICSQPGCNVLLDSKGYCAKHTQPEEKKSWRDAKTKPFAGAVRANDSLYNSTRWHKLRQDILERDQFRCQRCGELFAYGLQVHHRIPPRGSDELFFDANNCESVCAECHRKDTSRECRDRRNKI